VCIVTTVGVHSCGGRAHRRLFHGRPRTGRADRVSRAQGERQSRACIPRGHPAVRAPSRASRPSETGDRRQCSPRALPWVGRQLSGSRRYPGPSALTTLLPSGRRRPDPFRGGYHGTWLTPSAGRYRIHPERRLGVGQHLASTGWPDAQITVFCMGFAADGGVPTISDQVSARLQGRVPAAGRSPRSGRPRAGGLGPCRCARR
jgi:hypothetical protein